jgi:hypothetical protein
MGILDDAIREHLDLKRRHGARDAELREIEDEAFGAGEQPDPFSGGGELFGSSEAKGSTATEEPPAGLSEPPAGPGEPPSGLGDEPSGGEEPTRLVEPEALRPEPETSEPDLGIPDLPPAESDEPETPGESLEELIAEEEPFPEDTEAPQPPGASLAPETPLPDTELPEDAGPPPVSPEQESFEVPSDGPEEPAERPLEPSDSVPEPPPPPPDTGPEPPPPPPDTGPEPPGRARGRVDVPTQEHPPPGETGGLPPLPAEEPEYRPEPIEPTATPETDESFVPDEPESAGGPALYDFETDEDQVESPAPPTDEPADDFDALGPAEEEAPYIEEEEPYAEEPVGGTEAPADDEPFDDQPRTEVRPSVEEDDEEDDLWFEKGPPKDFDFDD